MTKPSLTPSAWAVLDQLARGPVEDGDLISKEGRTVLIRNGLARRVCNKGTRLASNQLTAHGKDLAARLAPSSRTLS
jgi:hypothetical protein